jgi:hypothetical protein
MKTLIKLFLVFAVVLAGLNIANAQNSRKERQAAKTAAVKKMIDNANYVFEANYVNPTRGAGRSLTDSYELKVSKDTISAYLPYFGRAYVAPVDPREGAIEFAYTKFDYNITEHKNGGWDIVIKPKEQDISALKDVQSLRLTISTNGYASLQVISSNRDPISFNGTIEKR